MRLSVQIKETELTKAFYEMENNLWSAEQNADWMRTVAKTCGEKVSFDQTMETKEGTFTFAMEIDLEKEKQIREEMAEKAEELKKLIQEYEKILVKKMTLALDASKSQDANPTFLE